MLHGRPTAGLRSVRGAHSPAPGPPTLLCGAMTPMVSTASAAQMAARRPSCEAHLCHFEAARTIFGSTAVRPHGLRRHLEAMDASAHSQANTWADVNPSGSLPSARYNSAGFWSNTLDGFFIYGGRGAGNSRGPSKGALCFLPGNLKDVWFYSRQAGRTG